MSWEIAKVEHPVARKNYQCQASVWIDNTVGFFRSEFDPEDWEKIKVAAKKDFKILKGEKYKKISGKFDGEFGVFRAIPELDDICKKYDLYDEG